jgi:hypothetical protein
MGREESIAARTLYALAEWSCCRERGHRSRRYPGVRDPAQLVEEVKRLNTANVDVVVLSAFAIKTGKALTPPAYEDVATFPVRMHEGMVQVRDPRWD